MLQVLSVGALEESVVSLQFAAPDPTAGGLAAYRYDTLASVSPSAGGDARGIESTFRVSIMFVSLCCQHMNRVLVSDTAYGFCV
jgi:hypothetical protein